MNFKAIQDEIIALRFPDTTAYRNLIKNAINAKGNQIWKAEDWLFKVTRPINLTTTASQFQQDLASLTDPDDTDTTLNIADVRAVYDDNEDGLTRLSVDEFFRRYPNYANPSEAGDVGVPEHWAFWLYVKEDGTRVERLLLGPAPQSSAVFPVVIERGWVDLVADADTPRWPASDHYLLVPGAMILMLKYARDDGWQALVPEFEGLYETMRRRWTAQVPRLQMPSDPLP